MHTHLTAVARVAATAVSAGTLGVVFRRDHWRRDNPFLVPDLAVCVLLLVAAAAPKRRAGPALLFAFGVSAGVLGTTVASAAVHGRLGVGSLAGLITAAVMSALLGRSPPPAHS